MANINLDRRAIINYKAVSGDSFTPPPVSFEIDDNPEDFSGCTLKMQIRKANELILSISNGADAGIQVSSNVIQYIIAAEDMKLDPGQYKYDVQKTTTEGIISTIQAGIIQIVKDETK